MRLSQSIRLNLEVNVCILLLQVDNNEMLRENLERLVGRDDSAFSGIDLATLIRNKYGRSYDVQLIKKVCYTVGIPCWIQLRLS